MINRDRMPITNAVVGAAIGVVLMLPIVGASYHYGKTTAQNRIEKAFQSELSDYYESGGFHADMKEGLKGTALGEP